MARIEKREEIAILTLAEKRILEKAYNILDEIYDESDGDSKLCGYVRDARDELDNFLCEEDICGVEDIDDNPSIKIIIEL